MNFKQILCVRVLWSRKFANGRDWLQFIMAYTYCECVTLALVESRNM
jgi:hypothetical protein